MGRRSLLAIGTALMALALLAPAATASAPSRWTDEFPSTYLAHAGEICDFEYLQEATITDRYFEYASGLVRIHETQVVRHTNLDTGYALHETDRLVFTLPADGSLKQVGIWFNLRDESGRLVLHEAGQVLVDAQGNLLKLTGNLSDARFRDVICPALGGHPA